MLILTTWHAYSNYTVYNGVSTFNNHVYIIMIWNENNIVHILYEYVQFENMAEEICDQLINALLRLTTLWTNASVPTNR